MKSLPKHKNKIFRKYYLHFIPDSKTASSNNKNTDSTIHIMCMTLIYIMNTKHGYLSLSISRQ